MSGHHHDLIKALDTHVSQQAEAELTSAYQIPTKAERLAKINEIRNRVIASLSVDNQSPESLIRTSFENLESRIVRHRIISGQPRIDGRDTQTVRQISIRTGVLPRTHGSALFTRGETQALVVTHFRHR